MACSIPSTFPLEAKQAPTIAPALAPAIMSTGIPLSIIAFITPTWASPLAEPLLLQVEHGTPQHIEAKRLLSFLGWVSPLEPDLVPDNSVLREFVGGSILRDYKPGQPG